VVDLHLYVEGGGGDVSSLKTACRKGFRDFLNKAGLEGSMPRIVACGGRRQAYDRFCIALKQGKQAAMLLVDSEEPVSVASPWDHLLQRKGDQWEKPPGSADDDCHFMVQCMESWFLADRDTLRTFFGQGYQANALPAVGVPLKRYSSRPFTKLWRMRRGTARPRHAMAKGSTRSCCCRRSIPPK
jgi:hypothetical protein